MASAKAEESSQSQALLEQWTAGASTVDARSAYVSWVGVGCPDIGGAHLTRLITALIDELSARSYADVTTLPEASEDGWLDARLSAGVPHVPAPLTVAFLAGLRPPSLPKTAAALAKRVVELATDADALTALLDDHSLVACHRQAAEALMAQGPPAARAVVERGPGLDPDVLAAALAKADPTALYPLLVSSSTGAFVDDCWYEAVLGAPGALRDPRWLDLAPELPDRGCALYLALAQDPRNDGAEQAVAKLSELAAHATDPLERGRAIYALGETGHPAATPALLVMFDDRDLPRICSALAKCGDTRALPLLERSLHGPYVAFVQSAIDRIRERDSEVHPSLLHAACNDDDPAIADLARRARAGDTDAAAVLEDALRERRAAAR